MKKRYLEFDIARVITLVLMPLAHIPQSAINSYIISENTYSEYAFIVKIASLGVFVFMCLLGVNILMTRHNSAADFAKRGCQLLLCGVGLNVVRYIIPGIFIFVFRHNPNYFFGLLYYSIASDILYFSAFCFFFFALSKKFNFSWYVILIIGCALNLLDYYLPTPVIENDTLAAIIGNFTYINDESVFSFSQWLVVVCIGYAFGTIYLKQDNKTSFYKKIFVISFVLLVATLGLCTLFHVDLISQIGYQFESSNLSLLGVFVLSLVYLFLQSIVYFISVKIKNSKIINFFVDFSKGITVYYILQWVIVCWVCFMLVIVGFGKDHYLNGTALIICGILIIIVSTVLTLLFQRKLSAKQKQRNTKDT